MPVSYAIPSYIRKNFSLTDTSDFQVGDLVTGNEDNNYVFTTCRVIMEVLEVSGKSMKVKIIWPTKEGKTHQEPFGVATSQFYKLISKNKDTVKEM